MFIPIPLYKSIQTSGEITKPSGESTRSIPETRQKSASGIWWSHALQMSCGRAFDLYAIPEPILVLETDKDEKLLG